MNTNKRKFLVTIFQPFVARAILYTGILNHLVNEGNDVEILVPLEKVEFYQRAYPSLSFRGINLSNLNTSLIHKMKFFFEYAIFTNIKIFHAQEVYKRDKNRLKYFVRLFTINTIGRSGFLKRCLRISFLWSTRNSKTGFENYFAAEQNIIALSCDVYNEYDFLFLLSAKQSGAKTIGMVRSWDNNVSKTLMPISPDLLVTQNQIMTEEVRRIHKIEGEIISIGIPYYETYKKYSPVTKENFLKKMGLPLNAKLILFSPAGGKFIDHDWQFCQILSEAIHDKTLPEDTYILVRCHPSNVTDLSKFIPNKHFIIERPGTILSEARNKENELDLVAIGHLIDSITHSSLVINILSSIIIDAAVINTPVVTPMFEGLGPAPEYLKSISRYQSEENMKTLLSIWNGSMPKDRFEFISEIRRILSGKNEHDLAAIERIRKNYCQDLDKSPSDTLFTLLSNKNFT